MSNPNPQYYFVPPTENANHEPLIGINVPFDFSYTLSENDLKKTVDAHPTGHFCIGLRLPGVELYKLGNGTNDQNNDVAQNVYYQSGQPLIFINRSYNIVSQFEFRLNFYINNGTGTAHSQLLNTQIHFYDPSCFNEGTKILSLNSQLKEEYIPIEHLKSGDIVKTYKHGYRKIDLIGKQRMINNPKVDKQCMYKMAKREKIDNTDNTDKPYKTYKNDLLEDLIVTWGHSILVDDLGEFKDKNDELFGGTTPKIDDKYLLLAGVSSDFKKLENTDKYTYYHFTLENNGNDDERFGVWTNGILTETPSKKQFLKHPYILL